MCAAGAKLRPAPSVRVQCYTIKIGSMQLVKLPRDVRACRHGVLGVCVLGWARAPRINANTRRGLVPHCSACRVHWGLLGAC